MTRFVAIKAAVALGGILVFVVGVHENSSGIRWVGVGLLGAAFLARFFDPAKRR
jgi:hypothetical protein